MIQLSVFLSCLIPVALSQNQLFPEDLVFPDLVNPIPDLIPPTTTQAPTTITVEDAITEDCAVCECYYKYTDRDMYLPTLPYAEVIYPTEQECLTLCWHEKARCKSVVYGIIRGRTGVLCSLYQEIGLPDNLYYRHVNNYYEPKPNCRISNLPELNIQVQEPDPAHAMERKFPPVPPHVLKMREFQRRRMSFDIARN